MSEGNGGKPHQDIRGMAYQMRASGARLITIVGVDRGDGTIELIYLFDRNGDVEDRRFVVEAEEEVDSISDIYAGATNMERENMDLLGMRFKGLEPGLLLVPGKSVKAPLRKRSEEET